MTDSLTQSDIDRIYGRLQQQINLKKIKSAEELNQAVTSLMTVKFWNDELSDFFFNERIFREPDIEDETNVYEVYPSEREGISRIEKTSPKISRRNIQRPDKSIQKIKPIKETGKIRVIFKIRNKEVVRYRDSKGRFTKQE